MNEFAVTFRPIGVIRSEHVCAQETPIQSNYAKGCQGRAIIFLEFAEEEREHLELLIREYRALITRTHAHRRKGGAAKKAAARGRAKRQPA